jgi:hypothetical protein
MLFAESIVIYSISAEVIQQEDKFKTIYFHQEFSDPATVEYGDYLKIKLNEANSVMVNQGSPSLPIFSKTLKLPWGADKINVKNRISEIKSDILKHKIESVPIFYGLINRFKNPETEINPEIYDTDISYPTD